MSEIQRETLCIDTGFSIFLKVGYIMAISGLHLSFVGIGIYQILRRQLENRRGWKP